MERAHQAQLKQLELKYQQQLAKKDAELQTTKQEHQKSMDRHKDHIQEVAVLKFRETRLLDCTSDDARQHRIWRHRRLVLYILREEALNS